MSSSSDYISEWCREICLPPIDIKSRVHFLRSTSVAMALVTSKARCLSHSNNLLQGYHEMWIAQRIVACLVDTPRQPTNKAIVNEGAKRQTLVCQLVAALSVSRHSHRSPNTYHKTAAETTLLPPSAWGLCDKLINLILDQCYSKFTSPQPLLL
jgi:hypothetical protein